jgi:hypothetical protein
MQHVTPANLLPGHGRLVALEAEFPTSFACLGRCLQMCFTDECSSIYHCMKEPLTYCLRSVRIRIKNETTFTDDATCWTFGTGSYRANTKKGLEIQSLDDSYVRDKGCFTALPKAPE